MAQPIEQLIRDIPPVTRVWVAAAIGTSILVVSFVSQCRPAEADNAGMSGYSSFTTLLLMDYSSRKGSSKLVIVYQGSKLMSIGMAIPNDFLLLWPIIARSSIPSFLHVRPSSVTMSRVED